MFLLSSVYLFLVMIMETIHVAKNDLIIPE